jgi:hypothetical protein
MFQINKFLNQLQDLSTGGEPTGEIGAFIESVDNDINWGLPWQTQHVRHTFLERVNVRFSYTATMF